ncbi:MAG: 1-deoxy-D-xylulose-5-phosphate reductoisomerase, partial [Bacilli bacterium]|nr:1-deoxy-D-xylulose-5-phosphate reductoisomerase [Bacilli bacterium]
IDSEHVALSKCFANEKEIKRLVLTASGGAFRDLPLDQLSAMKASDALKHPSWNMGEKITIDCATMMNKGFEIIEAYYLFNVKLEQIDILMHDESRIHSLIEYQDGSFLADIGPTDMRIPISYALSKRNKMPLPYTLSLEDLGSLHFRHFDEKRYPCVALAKKAISEGGIMPCILNASNEIAVNEFLKGKILFTDIAEVVAHSLDHFDVVHNYTLEDLNKYDKLARAYALSLCRKEK